MKLPTSISEISDKICMSAIENKYDDSTFIL